MQNCLLQSAQDRDFRVTDSSSVTIAGAFVPSVSSSGMIVLLLKHVHLQKDVGAGFVSGVV